MEKIFIHANKTAIYCNSPPMAELLRARGDRELTDEELTTYGMKGLEKWVVPSNTVVEEDGSITFTPPTQDQILFGPKTSKILQIDAAMAEIDQKMQRSMSDILAAQVGDPQSLSEDEQNTLNDSKAIFASLRELQQMNRELRQSVLDATSEEAIQAVVPKTIRDVSLAQ